MGEHLPPIFGVKIQKIIELPPPSIPFNKKTSFSGTAPALPAQIRGIGKSKKSVTVMTRWGILPPRVKTKKPKKHNSFGEVFFCFRTEDCVFLFFFYDFCGQNGLDTQKKTWDLFCLLKKFLLFKQCNKRKEKLKVFSVFAFGMFLEEKYFKKKHGKKKSWVLLVFAVSQVRMSSKNKNLKVVFGFWGSKPKNQEKNSGKGKKHIFGPETKTSPVSFRCLVFCLLEVYPTF